MERIKEVFIWYKYPAGGQGLVLLSWTRKRRDGVELEEQIIGNQHSKKGKTEIKKGKLTESDK